MVIAPCRDISNYQLLNLIQEGTYGVVTRGRDKQSGHVVALKKIKGNWLHSEEGFPITSLREIHILRQFDHPNIVKLHEVISSSSSFYLVLELVEHDLKGIMQTHGLFTISEVKTIMRQLFCGVGALHKRYIMHRDLKPSNLLLTNTGVVKIADFGLATRFGAQRPYTATVVTLWYRAPELLLSGSDANDYGPEIDMWSVGCIFGELLKNDVIFKGSSEIEQIRIIFQHVGVSDEDWRLIMLNGYPILKTLKKPKCFASGDGSVLDHLHEVSNRPLASQIRRKQVTDICVDLLFSLLAIVPKYRLVNANKASMHEWFKEQPLPKPQNLFPTFPSVANLEGRRSNESVVD